MDSNNIQLYTKLENLLLDCMMSGAGLTGVESMPSMRKKVILNYHPSETDSEKNPLSKSIYSLMGKRKNA